MGGVTGIKLVETLVSPENNVKGFPRWTLQNMGNVSKPFFFSTRIVCFLKKRDSTFL